MSEPNYKAFLSQRAQIRRDVETGAISQLEAAEMLEELADEIRDIEEEKD